MKKFILPTVILAALATTAYMGIIPFSRSETKTQERRPGPPPLAVTVNGVRLGNIEEKIEAVGSITGEASIDLAPKVGGRLELISIEVGDLVETGQLLAEIDKREFQELVREAEASLRVAEATLKGKEAELQDVKKKLERAETLFKKNYISQQDTDTLRSQAESARAQVELAKAQIAQMRARLDNAEIRLADTRVIAPFSGYVGKRYVDAGALVNTSTSILSIVAISEVKVVFPVTERDYGKMRPGISAAVFVDAYPGEKFSGRVARVAPVLDPDTRTAEVEVELANPSNVLKPGMFAKVKIVTGHRRNVLLVPEEALLKGSDGQGVYRLAGQSQTVEFVPVTAGLRDGGWVEIKGPLRPEDRVVTLGTSLLKEGQRVAVKAAGGGA